MTKAEADHFIAPERNQAANTTNVNRSNRCSNLFMLKNLVTIKMKPGESVLCRYLIFIPLIDMGTIDYNHENMLEFHEVPDQQIIITIDTLNVDLTL